MSEAKFSKIDNLNNIVIPNIIKSIIVEISNIIISLLLCLIKNKLNDMVRIYIITNIIKSNGG
jgi:hypothetical protein